jgi:hypothetical protein
MSAFAAIRRRVVDVPCMIDIERTAHSLHAHVDLEGVDVDAGDEVLVHGAPAHVAPGTQFTLRCRATVVRAGWIRRTWTRLFSRFELTLLYEVSFSAERWQAASRPTYKSLPRHPEASLCADATRLHAVPADDRKRVASQTAPRRGRARDRSS